jgi:ribosomal protein S18 acetylase RimI-like enzyme
MPNKSSRKRASASPAVALTICRATRCDLAVLADLNNHVQSLHARACPALFRHDPPPEEVAAAFEKMVEDPSALWLLAKTDRPAGYLYAQFRERPESWARPALRVCNISHLVVHPDFRRLGVARRLLSDIVTEAGTRGFARIELDVWAFNHRARAAFKRLGFAVFNERMALERIESPRVPAKFGDTP